MLETPDLMKMAQRLARHAGARQSQIAKNIANADVPGYRARDLADFSSAMTREVQLKSTRQAHLQASPNTSQFRTVDIGGEAAPNGNTVSLEAEMVRGTDAKSQHDLALTVYRNSLDILRTAISRGR